MRHLMGLVVAGGLLLGVASESRAQRFGYGLNQGYYSSSGYLGGPGVIGASPYGYANGFAPVGSYYSSGYSGVAVAPGYYSSGYSGFAPAYSPRAYRAFNPYRGAYGYGNYGYGFRPARGLGRRGW